MNVFHFMEDHIHILLDLLPSSILEKNNFSQFTISHHRQISLEIIFCLGMYFPITPSLEASGRVTVRKRKVIS